MLLRDRLSELLQCDDCNAMDVGKKSHITVCKIFDYPVTAAPNKRIRVNNLHNKVHRMRRRTKDLIKISILLNCHCLPATLLVTFVQYKTTKKKEKNPVNIIHVAIT